MKVSDKEVIRRYKAAYRLAHDCMNAINSGLPDQSHILALANTLLAADLATGGSSLNKHAGQDADQENMLEKAYERAPEVRPSLR